MADQKLTLEPSPPAPVVSRPLRTGKSFTLVLPRKRFVYRHWDKEKYLPGEEAQLVLEGEGIGSEKPEFVIERADRENGPWTPVATVQAKVEGDKATAMYKFPKPPPRGRLTRVEWKRKTAKPGDQLGMHVEARGYEGGFLSIHVERRGENGEWDVYSRWQGEIEQGKYDTAFLVPKGKPKPADGKDGKVVELSFERTPEENGRAWMVARTRNFDGSSLQFVLERSDASGNWEELGTAASTVKDGVARNSVPVPPIAVLPADEAGPRGAVKVRFDRQLVHQGEALVVWVDPKWLDGAKFEVTMERRVMSEQSGWEAVKVVKAGPPAAK